MRCFSAGRAPALKEAQKPRYLVIHATDIRDAAEQLQLVDRSHMRRGYSASSIINPATGTGYFIAYSYFIGKDGTVVQTRPDDDRTQHTSCGLGLMKCLSTPNVNDHSIAIVLAGDFHPTKDKGGNVIDPGEQPTAAQLSALRTLVSRLDRQYRFWKIGVHRDFSPTACPGDNALEALRHLLRGVPEADELHGAPTGDIYGISRYYTPERSQQRYFQSIPDETFLVKALEQWKVQILGGQYWYSTVMIGENDLEAYQWWSKHSELMAQVRKDMEYDADFKVNCSGDCLVTADGYRLKPEDAMKVAACPPDMPFGTRLQIDGIGTVTCHDHGSAIKGKRIDVWAGIGETGLKNIHNGKGGPMAVTILDN